MYETSVFLLNCAGQRCPSSFLAGDVRFFDDVLQLAAEVYNKSTSLICAKDMNLTENVIYRIEISQN